MNIKEEGYSLLITHFTLFWYNFQFSTSVDSVGLEKVTRLREFSRVPNVSRFELTSSSPNPKRI